MNGALTQARLKELLHYDPATGVFTWLVDRGRKAKAGDTAGTPTANGYVQIRVDGRIYLAHRLVWFYVHGEWPSKTIDHRHGDKTDNRITELRHISHQANNQNIRAANRLSKTGLLGASPVKGGFVSHIGVDGVVKHLGRFKTAEAAHQAYVDAKRRLHEGNTL